MAGATPLTVEDLAAMNSGCLRHLELLGKVFPGVDHDGLVQQARAIEASPVAQELLHQVLTLRKISP